MLSYGLYLPSGWSLDPHGILSLGPGGTGGARHITLVGPRMRKALPSAWDHGQAGALPTGLSAALPPSRALNPHDLSPLGPGDAGAMRHITLAG